MNLGGFYWLLNMLKTFSGFPTALCLVFVVIICAYQALRLGLLGWLYGRCTARHWPAPAVFAGAFAVSEFAFPLLFPWYFAATVHQVPILIQLAEVGGPIAVGLVLVVVNLAFAEAIRAVRKQSVRPAVIITGFGVLGFALAFGAWRLAAVRATVAQAEPVRVGYVQGNMGLFQKREKPGEGLRRHLKLTHDLRDKGVDFVVWSESSVTFAVPEDLAMTTPFYRDRFAGKLGVPALFGGVLFRADNDRERWFNTALATNRLGEIVGRYDKQFLLAFGEYLPFGDTFPVLYKWSPNSGRFSPGTSLEPIELEINGKKHTISVLICYEDILPGFTNTMVSHANPELIVNMTNDAWFGDTTEPWEHLALAKFRAIEHRRFLVRSTNSGVSAIVDPTGRVTSNTQTFTTEAQAGEVRWLKGGTAFERIGNTPWWILTACVAAMAFWPRRRMQSA